MAASVVQYSPARPQQAQTSSPSPIVSIRIEFATHDLRFLPSVDLSRTLTALMMSLFSNSGQGDASSCDFRHHTRNARMDVRLAAPAHLVHLSVMHRSPFDSQREVTPAFCQLMHPNVHMHQGGHDTRASVAPSGKNRRKNVGLLTTPVLTRIHRDVSPFRHGHPFRQVACLLLLIFRKITNWAQHISRQPTAVDTNPTDHVKTVSLLQRCRSKVPAAANSTRLWCLRHVAFLALNAHTASTDSQLCLEPSILLDPNARVLGPCCSRQSHDTHTRCDRWTCSHYLHADIGNLVWTT